MQEIEACPESPPLGQFIDVWRGFLWIVRSTRSWSRPNWRGKTVFRL